MKSARILPSFLTNLTELLLDVLMTWVYSNQTWIDYFIIEFFWQGFLRGFSKAAWSNSKLMYNLLVF